MDKICIILFVADRGTDIDISNHVRHVQIRVRCSWISHVSSTPFGRWTCGNCSYEHCFWVFSINDMVLCVLVNQWDASGFGSPWMCSYSDVLVCCQRTRYILGHVEYRPQYGWLCCSNPCWYSCKDVWLAMG